MGQNREKKQNKYYLLNSHLIIYFPTGEGVSEVSERVSAAERASEESSA